MMINLAIGDVLTMKHDIYYQDMTYDKIYSIDTIDTRLGVFKFVDDVGDERTFHIESFDDDFIKLAFKADDMVVYESRNPDFSYHDMTVGKHYRITKAARNIVAWIDDVEHSCDDYRESAERSFKLVSRPGVTPLAELPPAKIVESTFVLAVFQTVMRQRDLTLTAEQAENVLNVACTYAAGLIVE